jgi:hypothetical protein
MHSSKALRPPDAAFINDRFTLNTASHLYNIQIIVPLPHLVIIKAPKEIFVLFHFTHI